MFTRLNASDAQPEVALMWRSAVTVPFESTDVAVINSAPLNPLVSPETGVHTREASGSVGALVVYSTVRFLDTSPAPLLSAYL